jgi:hypothetical protein
MFGNASSPHASCRTTDYKKHSQSKDENKHEGNENG